MSSKYFSLGRWSLEEFEAVYEQQDASGWRESRGETVLELALRSRTPATLVAIANRLLDDGADATVINPSEKLAVLHLLFSRKRHDFALEAPLVDRLLDAGADLDWVSPGWGTPLQILARQLKCSDVELAPFYEVVFARPGIDLLKPGLSGRTSLQSARLLSERRPHLAARMEDYVTEHGLTVPTADWSPPITGPGAGGTRSGNSCRPLVIRRRGSVARPG